MSRSLPGGKGQKVHARRRAHGMTQRCEKHFQPRVLVRGVCVCVHTRMHVRAVIRDKPGKFAVNLY